MRWVIFVLFVIVFRVAEGAGREEAQSAARIVFSNVRILPMTGSGPLDNHTVVVSGNEITYVGTEPPDVPEDALVVDGEGKTLLPGLADMHAHYNHREDGILYIANGVTTVRDPWGVGESFAKDALAKAGVLIGPHVYSSGPTIDGANSAFSPRDIEVSTPEAAKGAVDALHAVGFQAIKIVEDIDAQSFRAAVEAARDLDLQVWAHTPSSVSTLDMLELRIDSLEHLDDYQYSIIDTAGNQADMSFRERAFDGWAELPVEQLRVAALQTRNAGVWNVPTLTAFIDMPQNASEPESFFARPELDYVNPSYIAAWQLLARHSADLARPDDNAVKRSFVGMLHEAGAELLVGTDAPNPFIVPGYSIHDELMHFEAAGISRSEILRIATAGAAKFLRREGLFGVVKAGARADLLVVAADPLSDLSILRDPEYVMMNGRLLTREVLTHELETLAERWGSLGAQPPYIGKVSAAWGNCDVSESMRCYDR